MTTYSEIFKPVLVYLIFNYIRDSSDEEVVLAFAILSNTMFWKDKKKLKTPAKVFIGIVGTLISLVIRTVIFKNIIVYWF